MPRQQARDGKKEKQWRSAIARWQASGLGPRAFCERENIDERQSFYWREGIRKRDLEGLPCEGAPPGSEGFASPLFLPVKVQNSAADRAPKRGVEIHAPGGLMIKIPPDVDPETLRSVLSAIREAQC